MMSEPKCWCTAGCRICKLGPDYNYVKVDVKACVRGRVKTYTYIFDPVSYRDNLYNRECLEIDLNTHLEYRNYILDEEDDNNRSTDEEVTEGAEEHKDDGRDDDSDMEYWEDHFEQFKSKELETASQSVPTFKKRRRPMTKRLRRPTMADLLGRKKKKPNQ